MRQPSLIVLFVVAAGIACGGDDDTGSTSDGTTGGTETTSSSSSSSATSPTTSATADSSSSTTVPATTESSGPATDSSSGSESGTGGEACLPEPEDDACAMCTKGMCCDQLVVCFEDPDCQCFADCYDEMGFMSDEMCRAECMLDANPDAWGDVYNCSAMNCLGDCI